ncbi:MAG: hypothetical protein WDW36_008694 [Sanguina aurantia]
MLPALSEFRLLETLKLGGCSRLKPEHFVQLSSSNSSLRSLQVSNCTQISSLASICQLTSLRELDISGCTGLRPDSLRQLTLLTNLSSLLLGGCTVRDADVARLTALRALALLSAWGTEAGSACFPSLAMCPALTSLDLSWTSAQQLPALPLLQVLKMAHCGVQGVWWPESIAHQEGGSSRVGDVPPLQELHLPWAEFGGREWEEVELFISMAAPALHTLDLSHTAAAGLECLQGAPRLTALNLAGCLVGDREALMVACCTRLKTLVLAGAGVGAPGVQHLASLPLIQKLDLSSTPCDDACMAALMTLRTLQTLDISNTPASTLTALPPTHQALPLVSTLTTVAPTHASANANASSSSSHGRASPPAAQSKALLQERVSAPAAPFPALRRLCALHTGLTASAVSGLTVFRDSLVHLSLGFAVAGPGGSVLPGRPRDSSVKVVCELTRLASLALEGWDLTGPGLLPLQHLPNLTSLSISHSSMLATRHMLSLLQLSDSLKHVTLDGVAVAEPREGG